MRSDACDGRAFLVALMVENLPGMQEMRFDPWVSKIPWRGNGYPLQCSCLENSMDRGAWWATVQFTKESDMT